MSNKRIKRSIKILYLTSITGAISNGMGAPFLGVFIARLGASASLLGIFQSLSNLFSTIFQVLWGYIGDKFRKYKFMVLIGGLLASLLWLFLSVSRDPVSAIVIASLQAFLSSIVPPSWLALLGLFSPPGYSGSFIASINFWSSLGRLLSTAFTGFFTISFRGKSLGDFRISFVMAGIVGIFSALTVLFIKEPKIKSSSESSSFKLVLGDIFKSKDFLDFIVISSFFGFFLSLSWPLFIMVVGDELKLRVLELSILSIASGISQTVVQFWAGRVADAVGKKNVIALGRGLLFLYPVVYGFFPGFLSILVANLFLNIAIGFLMTAIQSLLIDITPADKRGSYTAFYNLSMGLSFSLGSLTGGFLADVLKAFIGYWAATRLIFVISSIGRFTFGIMHIKIKEKSALSMREAFKVILKRGENENISCS